MRLSSLGAVLSLAAAAALGAATFTLAGEPEGIEGSYKLVSRDLPDGKVVHPPDVQGFVTYTKGYRNFNVAWKDEKGNPVSLSYIAGYELTKDKYCEKPLFWLQSNLGEPGVQHTWPAAKGECSPVTRSGDKISFDVKGEPPRLTWEGDKMTATAKGLFVDHWEKVK
jgi:hypothetical protein